MRATPIALVVSLFGSLLIQPFLPVECKQAIYTVGLCAKSTIMVFLPFVVFGMIFRSSSTMTRNATHLLSRLLLGIAVSTFIAVFIGSGIGLSLYHIIKPLEFPSHVDSLEPFFYLPSLVFFKNEWAMLSGLILGIILGKGYPKIAQAISRMIQSVVHYSLKIIGLSIPFFICGFIIKMGHDGIIVLLLKKYFLVFSTIVLSTIFYLFVIYLYLAQWSFSQSLFMIRNILPAAISGMATMSSAASLPFLVKGVERNTKNKNLADFASPIAVNVHMVGECFANIILAYAILKTYNVAPPDLPRFFSFSVFFFLARFSCAGIPGGGTLITIPLFKKYFCFNNEMASLITTLNLFLDPFITGGNLLGDGALCQWLARTSKKKKKI